MMRYFLFGIAFFGLALVTTACKNVQHVAYKQANYLEANPLAFQEEDSTIAAFIVPYREQMEAEMNQIIGHAGASMQIGTPHNPLGNWMCDALAVHFRGLGYSFDFAITNPGGIRIPAIESGPVFRSTIYELMPFDNYMVVLELDGTIVQQLFDHTLEFGGWPVGENVYYSHSGTGTTSVVINGEPINKQQQYRMLVSDYIANGGDRCDFLKELHQQETGILMRDALMQYIKSQTAEGLEITAPLEKRVEFH